MTQGQVAAFAADLEALVAKYGQKLNDNEVITALEGQLSRAWSDACEPQPAGLWTAAPAMLEALKLARAICCDAFKDTAMEWDHESMAIIDAAVALATNPVAGGQS